MKIDFTQTSVSEFRLDEVLLWSNEKLFNNNVLITDDSSLVTINKTH